MSTILSQFLDIARHIQDALERGDKTELNRIHKFVLRAESRDEGNARPADRSRSPYKSEPIDDAILRAEFMAFSSREDLEAHLKRKYSMRTDLEKVARTLQVPITKTDTYDSLVNKVVDSTLGYKLRSSAIRGDSSKD